MIKGVMVVTFVVAAAAQAQLQPGEVPVEGLPEVVAKTITLGWDYPTENEDGTPLTDLAGFRIYWGVASGVYTQVSELIPALPGAESMEHAVRIDNVLGGLHFAVTALDTSGNESAFSENLEYQGNVPAAPVNLILRVEATQDLTSGEWEAAPWFFRLKVESVPALASVEFD